MVGCFGFNVPLRQYFSLYRAVSQWEGEEKIKRELTKWKKKEETNEQKKERKNEQGKKESKKERETKEKERKEKRKTKDWLADRQK